MRQGKWRGQRPQMLNVCGMGHDDKARLKRSWYEPTEEEVKYTFDMLESVTGGYAGYHFDINDVYDLLLTCGGVPTLEQCREWMADMDLYVGKRKCSAVENMGGYEIGGWNVKFYADWDAGTGQCVVEKIRPYTMGDSVSAVANYPNVYADEEGLIDPASFNIYHNHEGYLGYDRELLERTEPIYDDEIRITLIPLLDKYDAMYTDRFVDKW